MDKYTRKKIKFAYLRGLDKNFTIYIMNNMLCCAVNGDNSWYAAWADVDNYWHWHWHEKGCHFKNK